MTSNAVVPSTTAPTLSEADPKSLEELFSRDPLQLTREDRDAIVAEMRKKRVSWEADEKAKASKPKKQKVVAPTGPINLTLDDLLS